jgi:para-nitrobenzyl esterase
MRMYYHKRKAREGLVCRERSAKMQVIKTDKGYISGTVIGEPGREVSVFRGIPFAAPPVGELRWRPPQPPEPWSGIRECTRFTPISPQMPVEGVTIAVPEGEDCLYLNVVTPAKSASEKLPVLVWLHGGAYAMGSGNEAVWNNYRLPLHGAVVVAVNHRLGPIGLIAHPELSAEQGGASGNYLFLDIIASLQWVQRNIAGFGGDPANVTVFGESGGGAKVSMMLLSPLAKGLFHRAVCESGTATFLGQSLNHAEEVGKTLFAKLGVTGLAEARKVPFQKIIEAAAGMELPRNPTDLPRSIWDGTVDGRLLPAAPPELLAAGKINAAPLIVCANFGELVGPGMLVMPWIVPEYVNLLKTVNRLGSSGYAMVFDRVPAGWRQQGCNAMHAIELGYVFGDYDGTTELWTGLWRLAQQAGATAPDPGFNAADRTVSEAMMSLWTSFAADGKPRAAGVPSWPAWDESDRYLYVSEKPEVREGFSKVAQ